MTEKWVHVKTGKHVEFDFEKVNSTCQDSKKYCSYAPDCKFKEVQMDCPHLCNTCPKDQTCKDELKWCHYVSPYECSYKNAGDICKQTCKRCSEYLAKGNK